MTVAGTIAGGDYTAGVVAYTTGAVTIEDYVNKATISTASSNTYTGGIAGYVISSSAAGSVTIENCNNEATVTGGTNSGNVGGIVGNAYGSTKIIDCVNSADITGGTDVGGVVGGASNGVATSRCGNSGDVTATRSFLTSQYSAGGVVGSLNGSTSGATVDQCYNTGAVKVTGILGAGGVVGYMQGGYASVAVTQSYNTGNVTSTASSATASAGGVVGTFSVQSAKTTAIRSCYSTGAGTASTTAMNGSGYCGGVAGCAAGVTNVTNNYYLEDTAAKGIGGTTGDDTNAKAVTADELKATETIMSLSETSRAFAGDSGSVNGGYPILRWQTNDTSELVKISIDADPDKLAYNAGDTFDPSGLDIRAQYTDGISALLTDYTKSLYYATQNNNEARAENH